jgi:photosystem II stability/assembly factor-like uncharacterized protein
MNTFQRFCLCIAAGVLVDVHSARAGGRDLGPEVGLLFNTFVFGGPGELLGNSGRGGVFTTNSRGEHWQRSMRGLTNASGAEATTAFVCQAASSPGVLYAATLDGLYRTDNFAKDWVALAPLRDPQWTACDVDPGNPDIVYAVSSQFDPPAVVVVKSIDGGRSFAVVGNGLPPLDQAFQIKVAPADRETIYIMDFGTFEGTYVSHDSGLNFARLDTAPEFPFLVFPSPTDASTLFVSTFDGLYRSIDGGATFEFVLATVVPDLAFDPLERSTLYAAAGPAGLFRSDDGGASFTPFGALPRDQLGAIGANAIGVQLTKAGRSSGRSFYVNASPGTFRSDDGAQTFVPIERGYRAAHVNDLAFDGAGRLLIAVINSEGMFRATQGGRYEVLGRTIPDDAVSQVEAVAVSPDDPDVYVVVTIGGTFRTADGGASWTRSEDTPIGPAARVAFAPGDSRKVYAVGGGDLLWSVDGGQSFTHTRLGRFGSVAVDPVNADIVYVGALNNSGVMKSVDGARTLQTTGLTTGNFSVLAVDPLDPDVVYAGHRTGTVFRSSDGGATFAAADSGLAGAGVLGMGIEAVTRRVYAWMAGGGLFRSDDGAATWTAVDTADALRRSGHTSAHAGLAIDPARPGHVFLGLSSVLEVVDGM